MRYFRKILGLLLIAGGLAAFLYPYVSEMLFDYRTTEYVQEFNDKYGISNTEADTEIVTDNGAESGEKISTDEDDTLYAQCAAYNQKIYEEEQSGLIDAWSYERAAIAVSADEFGYIEIPAMDLVMPLYLGASEENMAKGAVVLGQTSIPIGGENTNAVIAAHRGYRGTPYFREIEKLSIGDAVYVTNRWGTLTYTVIAIDIISPSDKDAIKIQEGKDMVTLITCHPYRSHGKYRYVVYCERSDGEENMGSDAEDTEAVNSGTLTASDGRVYELSDGDINREKTLRRICFVGLVIIFVIILVRTLYEKARNRHRYS